MTYTSYTSYEHLEETFRHVCVQGLESLGKDDFPVFEQHVTDPLPDGNYGVVSLVAATNIGFSSNSRRLVNNNTQVEVTQYQAYSMMFSVELLGDQSRDLIFQLQLWFNSNKGVTALNDEGIVFYDASNIRPLHQLIPSGREYERRCQMDVNISCNFEVGNKVFEPVIEDFNLNFNFNGRTKNPRR